VALGEAHADELCFRVVRRSAARHVSYV